jgi:oligopeptide transport system permease protein
VSESALGQGGKSAQDGRGAQGGGSAPTGSFGEPIKGVSLWVDAWRRLRRNRIALIGLFVVLAYTLVALLAPVLPIHSYKHQVLDHQYFPPSLTKTAGTILAEREE